MTGCAATDAPARVAPTSQAVPSPRAVGAVAQVHPFLLFSDGDTDRLAQRRHADPLLEEWWVKLEATAAQEATAGRGEDPNKQYPWTGQLEARAFVARIKRDPATTQRAIELMRLTLDKVEPVEFYEKSDFHYHAAPLRAYAYAWDWLYESLTPEQRREMLPKLEKWVIASFNHLDKSWWRDASYNVGAIPVAGTGLLALSIEKDTQNPAVHAHYAECRRRIQQNYFPLSWKESGIGWEGPNYAILGFRYPAPFAEAVRRVGGPNLLGESGARFAMQYQMHQWLPQGGCAQIGDNVMYGGRTFAPEYLLGIGLTNDAESLWTWRKYTHRSSVDPLIAYLWYPLNVTPKSPVETKLETSRYFEVTPNRAGYFFSRSKWDDKDAASFSFVTRFEMQNHQHYDHHSILLGAYGTNFATHWLLYQYGHERHGTDFEHNTVVIDGGGWPSTTTNSCGDKNSTDGLLVGVVASDFADYVRGDGKWSYRDNTVPLSNPAIRAERAALFVKDGQTPYLFVVDDQQYREVEHSYTWLWHTPSYIGISGTGTVEQPLLLTADRGRCAIRFITPEQPSVTAKKIQVLKNHTTRTQPATSQPVEISKEPPATQPTPAHTVWAKDVQRIDVEQRGVRVQFAALATLEKNDSPAPVVRALQIESVTRSRGVAIEFADGTTDHVIWQPEETGQQFGVVLVAGDLETDGLMAMVRVREGKVVGYVLGEGTYLKWAGETLVQAERSVCVAASETETKITGRRRSREGLPTIEPGNVKTAKLGK